MINEMYRLNPELGSYEKLYLYGNHQAEEDMDRILQKQNVKTMGSLKESGSQPLKDAAVILCSIDSEMADLQEKGVHTVFIPRWMYQEEILFLEHLTDIIPKNLFVGVPELDAHENVIFGVGENGHRLFMETMNIGIYITAFCDSNPGYQGMRLLNKPILSLDELCQKHKDSNILIGSRHYFEEISRLLFDSGFKRLYRWE